MNKRKYISFLSTFTFIMFSVFVNAQSINLAESLKTKDYPTISKQLADEIDLCVLDDTQINSRDEAMERIKVFIKNNPIQSIETLHKGTSDAAGSKYNVYKLTTSEKVIRAFVYFEGEGAKQVIKELRFDKF